MYAFTLGNGDSVSLRLIRNTHYEIKEDNEDYEASFLVTDEDGTTLLNGSTGTAAYALGEDQTVAFTNTRDVRVPTSADVGSYTALLLLAILPAAGLLLQNRRRKREVQD